MRARQWSNQILVGVIARRPSLPFPGLFRAVRCGEMIGMQMMQEIGRVDESSICPFVLSAVVSGCCLEATWRDKSLGEKEKVPCPLRQSLTSFPFFLLGSKPQHLGLSTSVKTSEPGEKRERRKKVREKEEREEKKQKQVQGHWSEPHNMWARNATASMQAWAHICSLLFWSVCLYRSGMLVTCWLC